MFIQKSFLLYNNYLYTKVYTLHHMIFASVVKPFFQKVVIVPGFMDIDPKLEAYKHYIKSTVINIFFNPTTWISQFILFCRKIVFFF